VERGLGVARDPVDDVLFGRDRRTGRDLTTAERREGSGGDIRRTCATASPVATQPFLPGGAYAVTGDKHFGSGFGITDRMMITAIPEGIGPDDLRARRARPTVGWKPQD
jgi:hypothetical protein